ncbi:MAG: hypothetical protein CVT82_07010 [Alphaproteobacteria bacterium HGW-Alphaproteobacteria-4]|nr:MAG: hypothetical protein CVT82_07010 [Alphaproteobacteria bacterium HGW-Alphaproteobacteria-4]
MMIVPVKSLLGIMDIPSHRTSAKRWLARAGVTIRVMDGDGRKPEAVELSDLPEEVQRAYAEREIARAGLEPGEWDAEAQVCFLDATPTMRSAALRRAEIARFMLARQEHMGSGALARAVRERFGSVGTSEISLRRIREQIKGVAPINYAPALLHDYAREGGKRAAMSEEAWAFFMTTLRDAGPQFPLRQAWRDVRDISRKMGWACPSFTTVFRRWSALDPAQKLVARHGHEAAAKALSMPIMRDKTTLGALQLVSLDGRTLDFWVDFGDGKAARPVMIALVDVATNFVLGYELAKTENAVATSRVIRHVSRDFGIFDRLYTDNGSAFSGHLVAGGNVHKWRGKRNGAPGVKPLGVCQHLGIEVTFAIPKNAQAKIAERTFATLSRVIDDRPEFAGAHAGHAPGASPNASVRPVPMATAEAVIAREIARHNREAGRASQGARGRSYEAHFRALLAERTLRKPSKEQLYYAGLIYSAAAVDRFGRITIETWTYGGPATQAQLLPWHGKGRVLIGRDPDDFEAPAVAFDEAGRLICKGIEPVKPGAYNSVEGASAGAKNRKAARVAVAQAADANDYLDDASFAAALAALGTADEAIPPAAAKVVGARFGGPLQPKRKAAPKSALTQEYLEILDRAAGVDLSRYGV